MRPKVFQSLKIIILAGALLGAYSCGGQAMSDEEAILQEYTKLMKAFEREDLRGVMKIISKDFRSAQFRQQTYREVFEYRKQFILDNSNVSVDFRDISVETDGSHARVSLTVNIQTDQVESRWSEIDSLQKQGGNWKIISWEYGERE